VGDIKIITSDKEENRDIDKQKEKRERDIEARETKQADRHKRLWINM
jgi:hypothetical protein